MGGKGWFCEKRFCGGGGRRTDGRSQDGEHPIAEGSCFFFCRGRYRREAQADRMCSGDEYVCVWQARRSVCVRIDIRDADNLEFCRGRGEGGLEGTRRGGESGARERERERGGTAIIQRGGRQQSRIDLPETTTDRRTKTAGGCFFVGIFFNSSSLAGTDSFNGRGRW